MTISKDDLLRIVREDRDVRDTLRREILTEDQLKVPGRIEGVLTAQNELLKEQKRLREETNALRETQNTVLETLASVLSGMTTIEESIRQSRSDTRSDIREVTQPMQAPVDRCRSVSAMDVALKNGLSIVRPFARHRGIRRTRYTIVDSNVVDAMIEEHDEELEKLNFSDNEIESVREADLVFEVARRRDPSPSFYVLVEVSYTGQLKGVDRASRRARMLSVATGLDTYPVVASVRLDRGRDTGRIIEDFDEFIKRLDDEVAYWHRLEDEDVLPPHSR